MRASVVALSMAILIPSGCVAQEAATTAADRGSGPPATSEQALVLLPGEPADEPYDSSRARFLVSRPDWSMAELEEAPGYKTPLHRHSGWDETFYVLSGTLTVHVAGKTYDLGPGRFLRIPRGTPHGQANFGAATVRFLLDMKPGGFERHLKDRIALARTTPPGSKDFVEKWTRSIVRMWI